MNNYSEFSAFIESVCTKVGCPDAAPYLQQGFRAYVEANDTQDKQVPFTFSKAADNDRNYIVTVNSHDGWDLDSVKEFASTIQEIIVRDFGKYVKPDVYFMGSYSDDNGGSDFQIYIGLEYDVGVGKSNIKHCVQLAYWQFETVEESPRPTVESLSDTYADDPFARNKLRTRLVRKPPTTKDIETAVTKSMDKGETNQKAMSLDQFGKFYDKKQTEKQNERVRQTGQYNDMMARQNANTIRNLPWDNIKDLFPNAYCILVGEVWQMKYLRRDKDKDAVTGKGKVLGAVGEYVPKTAPEKFDNPTMAALAAKRFFTPGHWTVQRVIPELGDQDILAELPSPDDDRFANVINSDS